MEFLLGVVVIGFSLKPSPIAVEMHVVSAGPIRVLVTEEGKTRVVDRYELRAPVSGILRRIELEVGAAVSAGQPLVWIDPLPSQALDWRTREEASARLASTKARLAESTARATAVAAVLTRAEKEAQRVAELFAQGHATETESDASRSALESQQAAHRAELAAVEAVTHEVTAAEAALARIATPTESAGSGEVAGSPDAALQNGGMSDTSIEDGAIVGAPSAGVVLARHRDSGGLVQAGDLILTIADAAQLEVVVDVLSEDAVQFEEGMKVSLERWGGAKPLDGRVLNIEPSAFLKTSALGVEEQRVLVIVELLSPRAEWKRLGDGYRVEANFVLFEKEDALQVPNGALFRNQSSDGGTAPDGWALFVVDGDTLRRAEVVLGARSGLFSEVLAGVAAGERVVVHPQPTLAAGSLVSER